MAYAIWNSKYKKWLYGTDFRCWPHRQILDEDTPRLWRCDVDALWEREHRHCGKEYKVVMVEVVKICEVNVKDGKAERERS